MRQQTVVSASDRRFSPFTDGISRHLTGTKSLCCVLTAHHVSVLIISANYKLSLQGHLETKYTVREHLQNKSMQSFP